MSKATAAPTAAADTKAHSLSEEQELELVKWKSNSDVAKRAAEKRETKCKGTLFHPVTFDPVLMWSKKLTKRFGPPLEWKDLPAARQEYALYDAADVSLACESGDY